MAAAALGRGTQASKVRGLLKRLLSKAIEFERLVIAMTIATEVTTTSGNLEVPLPRSPLPDPGGAERSGFFLGPFGLLGGCCARIFLY